MSSLAIGRVGVFLQIYPYPITIQPKRLRTIFDSKPRAVKEDMRRVGAHTHLEILRNLGRCQFSQLLSWLTLSSRLAYFLPVVADCPAFFASAIRCGLISLLYVDSSVR